MHAPDDPISAATNAAIGRREFRLES